MPSSETVTAVYTCAGQADTNDVNGLLSQLMEHHAEPRWYWIEPTATLPTSGKLGPLQNTHCLGMGRIPNLDHPIDEVRLFADGCMIHVVHIGGNRFRWFKICENKPPAGDGSLWTPVDGVEIKPKCIYLHSVKARKRFGIEDLVQGQVDCREYWQNGRLVTWRIVGLDSISKANPNGECEDGAK